MNQDNSSFGDNEPNNLFEDIQELKKSGATSDTYKVRLYGKWHFLKRLKNEYRSNPLYVQAFEKEFDLGFQLDHPNIVKYHSKGNDLQGFYIVTEYVEGLNLQEYIDVNQNFFNDRKLIVKIIKQLLVVLDYLHNNQVIHLDIKPENILITTKSKNIKLIDLGFSSSDGYEAISCGTQSFASPEQFNDPSLIDVTSDIFSVGRLLIYLFTGNTNIESINLLPQPYRNIAKRCLRIKTLKQYKNIQEIINQIEFRRKKSKVLFILGLVLSAFLIYSTVVHFTMNKITIVNYNTTSDSIQFDTRQIINHIDSAVSLLDKEFPKIELANINEASIQYNKILNDIYSWKEKRKLVLSETQKVFYEDEFKRILNIKTKKYLDSFNKIIQSTKDEQNPVVLVNPKLTVKFKDNSIKSDSQITTAIIENVEKISTVFSHEDSLMIEKITNSDFDNNKKAEILKRVHEFSTESQLHKNLQNNMDMLSTKIFDFCRKNDANLNPKSDPEKLYLSELFILVKKFMSNSQELKNYYFDILYKIDRQHAAKLVQIYSEESNKFSPRIGIYLKRYEKP